MQSTLGTIDRLLELSKADIPELAHYTHSLQNSQRMLRTHGAAALDVARENVVNCLHQILRSKIKNDPVLFEEYTAQVLEWFSPIKDVGVMSFID